MDERIEKISEAQWDAAHRMLHTNVDGLQELKVTPDKPWLNTIDVVDGHVRNFVEAVLRRMPDVGKDMTPQSFFDWISWEATKLNILFLGYEPGETHPEYTRGIWNTPGQCGHFVTIHGNLDCQQRLAVRDLLVVLASNVVTVMRENDGKPLSEYGWMLDSLIQSAVRNILGLPPEIPVPAAPAADAA